MMHTTTTANSPLLRRFFSAMKFSLFLLRLLRGLLGHRGRMGGVWRSRALRGLRCLPALIGLRTLRALRLPAGCLRLLGGLGGLNGSLHRAPSLGQPAVGQQMDLPALIVQIQRAGTGDPPLI